MNTKYGSLPDEMLLSYLKRLTDRIFKILPMKEENCQTLSMYLDGLQRELIGNKQLIIELKENQQFLILLATLEQLQRQGNMTYFKSDVFKCINIAKQLHSSIESGEGN